MRWTREEKRRREKEKRVIRALYKAEKDIVI
jgi:hypothetical protein